MKYEKHERKISFEKNELLLCAYVEFGSTCGLSTIQG